MHGRRAAAAMLAAAAAFGGCGGDARIEPVKIEVVEARAAVDAPPRASRKARPGRAKNGTLRTRQLVPAPAPASPTVPPAAEPAPRSRPAKPSSPQRFRAVQLEVLRAHCATRPANDPRCDGARVNERVAFAAFEAQR